MSAQDFLGLVSEVIYLAMFVVTAAALLRTRTLVALDTFLFFGTIALLLLLGNAAELMNVTEHPLIGDVSWVGVAALPYLLLRLVDAFRPQPAWLMLLAPLEFLAISAVGVIVPQPWPIPVSLLVVGHFVLLVGYGSASFMTGARQAQGVTRRRMQAVAAGSGLLALAILLAGIQLVLPAVEPVTSLVSQVVSLAAVAAYFIGFAPPASCAARGRSPPYGDCWPMPPTWSSSPIRGPSRSASRLRRCRPPERRAHRGALG